MFEWLENQALARAEAVITICPELAEYAIPRVADPARPNILKSGMR